MKKIVTCSILAVLSLSVASIAQAQGKPETLVKQRQAVMTLQGKYFGPMAGMAKGKVPFNAAVIARNAAYLDVLDKMAWDGFKPSTKDVKSRALPEVYSDAAKFKAEQEELQANVTKLLAASKSGDEAGMKAANCNRQELRQLPRYVPRETVTDLHP